MENQQSGGGDENLQKQIGKRLVAARKARGWSIDRLAESLGVSRATIGHWETGGRTIKVGDLTRLCQILGASADDILFGERRWPFQHVALEVVESLEPTEIAQLEGAMGAAADALGIKLRSQPSFTETTTAQTVGRRSSSGAPSAPIERRSLTTRRRSA